MRSGASLALLVVIAVSAAGCGGGDEKPLIAASKAAVVRGELVPAVHLFGEPVVARIDVILDREKVDAGGVRLKANFEPYEKVGETHEERVDIGDYAVLRYTTTLRCLNEDCIPPTTGNVTISQTPELPIFPESQNRDYQRKYEFPPALVTVDAEPKDRTLGRVVWAPLRSLSRINWYDSSVVGQGFPFAMNVTPLPDPSYRLSPTAFGVVLVLLALALVAVPFLLFVRQRRGRRAPAAAPDSRLSPLERALALVEWASGRPSVDERREALEALAFELDAEAEDGSSAKRAREQGWSPPSPEPEDMTSLVASIRENDAAAS